MKSYAHLTRRGVLAAACALAAATSAARADTVSATPGTIKGVIHFLAPFVPDSMTVDALDSNLVYRAQANATQGQAGCATESQDWCYSIVVESALANSYSLRPIAYIARNPPFVSARAPFPPTAQIAISAGQVVTAPDITFNPGEISGSFSAFDMNNVELPFNSVYMSSYDVSPNSFPESCGGSLAFCPFNSVYQSSLPDYRLYLKWQDSYTFLYRGFTLSEGPGVQTSVSFDDLAPLGIPTPGAGQDVTQNYVFTQKASVSGSTNIPGQSIYNYQVSLLGTTINNKESVSTYAPINSSPTPLLPTQLTYTGRIFDNTDLTKPVYIQPLFTMSTDGSTLLEYPPTQIAPNLNAGDQRTIDFSGTSASIAGQVLLTPPYPRGPLYPGIQAESVNSSGGIGLAQAKLSANGTYLLPAFGGNWDYWRMGMTFDLGNPNFTTNYFISQFLNINVPVANGQNLTGNNFNFSSSLLKVYFTAPAGTTISDPQLDAITGTLKNGVFTPDALEVAHAAGLNQKMVPTGEVRMVLRPHSVAYQVTPSAVINTSPNSPGTSRTDFSPFVIAPNPGDVTVVGIPGTLSLTVTSPQNGQNFPTCQVAVTGTATGAQNISITVNGKIVPATSAGNPNDPNQVLFNTTVPGAGPNTVITVVASAPNNTPVSDSRTVSATGGTVTVGAQVGTSMLWPPNHDLANVGLQSTAHSSCDANPTLGIQVYSTESDTQDTGSGNFSPDAANIAPTTLRLRAERAGDGPGRVYLIIASGADHSGDTGWACATVVVPHAQDAGSIATVQAMASSAAGSCQATGHAPAGYMQVGTGPIIGPKQ